MRVQEGGWVLYGFKEIRCPSDKAEVDVAEKVLSLVYLCPQHLPDEHIMDSADISPVNTDTVYTFPRPGE